MYSLVNSSEHCFVCDAEVMNKGIYLSLEETYFTKTAFPTKISELMGDDFLVVVCEEDRLCSRCASLINQSDKLEMDLRELRRILSGFLNAKYNLNKEDAYLNISGESKQSKTDDDCEDFTCLKKPVTSLTNNKYMQYHNKHVQTNGEGGPDLLEEPENFNNFTKNGISDGLEVKNESQSYKYFNSSINHCDSSDYNEDPSNLLTSCILKNVLSEDGTILDKKPSDFNHFSSKINSGDLQLSKDLLVGEVKNEKLSSDYSLLNPTSSPLQPTTDEGTQSEIANDSSLTNYSPVNEEEYSTLSNEKPDKTPLLHNAVHEIASIPETTLLNDSTKKDLRKKSTAKTTSIRNNLRKDSEIVSFRKLRPILPKITKLSDISLCAIENSFHGKSIALSNNDNAKVESAKNKVIKNENTNLNGSTNSNINLKVDKNSAVKDQRVGKTNKNLYCKICKTNFETVEALKTHRKEHTKNSKLNSCGYCQKTFKSRLNLSVHEAGHTGKFAFCCDFCGQGFMYRSNLEEHRRGHTKEEHYICDVCGKKFTFHSTYWIHRKWHDNPYPYKCNECGRLFKHSSLLSVHRRKHTGERPYKCSYCPLTFNVSTSLKRHLILHTKEYPFNCDSCKQGFTTRFKYSDHMARIHSIIVDKPVVDKKDYKMAVYDNVIENTSSDQVETVETINIDVADNPILRLSDELSGNIVEIVLNPSVLNPSVLTNHNLSLTDSWLT